MYLKKGRIVVTIRDTVFRTSKSGTGDQLILDPTALTGWDDGTNARRNATARPVSNGDFREPYTHSSRLIALTGTAIASNRGGLLKLRDKLTGLFAQGEYIEISVETEASTRFAVVGLENSVSFIQQSDNVASFRIELYAPDAHLYGLERTFTLGSTTQAGGGLRYPLAYPLSYNVQNLQSAAPTMANNGNAPSWPKFKVSGDYYAGFTVTDGRDKKVTYSSAVYMSSPVTIDMAKGTATQNGVDKTVYVSERDWFSVLPGETIRPEFKPIQSASGWCDIIIRDTFI